MIGKIDCFLPCSNPNDLKETIEMLRRSKTIRQINLLVDSDFKVAERADDCTTIVVDNLLSTDTMRKVSENAEADYVLLVLKSTPLVLGQHALDRLLRVATDTQAALVYSDYHVVVDGKREQHPVIDYQMGSLRDDFDFGSLLFIRADLLHEYAATCGKEGGHQFDFAGLYDLRLFLSRKGELFHINEYLYTAEEFDTRKSGERQFDYVNPRNREVQIEMEKAVTLHLEAVGARIDTHDYEAPNFNREPFNCEASVVIPVYNRERTIADAVKSALQQEADFKYNVIVVNNHSSDHTGDILSELAC